MTSLIAVLLTLSAAQQPVAPVPDERVAYLGGGNLLLERRINDAVIGDPATNSALARIGVREWCRNLRGIRVETVARHGSSFKSMLVSVVRRVVPASALASPAAHGWDSVPIMSHRNRIISALDREAGPLFFTASSEAVKAFRRASDAAPTAIGAAAREPFKDWDLTRPIALGNACHLLSDQAATRDQFLKRKLIFDGFHKRKDTR